MLAYCFFLKQQVVVDVLIIASGFVIRAEAGALAIEVPLSTWLILCAFLLALFLGLAKRKHELSTLGEDKKEHRKVLSQYSHPFLDQMIAISAGAVIVCYALYTVDYSSKLSGPLKAKLMPLTVLFVIYGIFRYLYQVYHQNQGGKPEDILIKDFPFLLNILLYLISVSTIFYFRHD